MRHSGWSAAAGDQDDGGQVSRFSSMSPDDEEGEQNAAVGVGWSIEPSSPTLKRRRWGANCRDVVQLGALNDSEVALAELFQRERGTGNPDGGAAGLEDAVLREREIHPFWTGGSSVSGEEEDEDTPFEKWQKRRLEDPTFTDPPPAPKRRKQRPKQLRNVDAVIRRVFQDPPSSPTG